ncbi:hypothetical protein LZQ00_09835 [Sphingobacterium sp. SRCM116780]|uniref:hypothetical protein n=1 Tax=Sphingobacterium sp. SRCM116780 TaxID=2907623 RepID=UPI001F281656|nr:hypothetical protein [Sphingobacterium sp. SRCM116780]UIR54573.1 hypothetical protein LZQ00_09835 [Sphingobacterium sp. SRCM116780]
MKSSALLLILAAILYWLSWFLMPDQGTADTKHILTIVSQNRQPVLVSVMVGILSSVLYLISLMKINIYLPKTNSYTMTGSVLLAIGAMGMCVDAFFHLFAFFMTDPSIHMDTNIVQLMTFVQTTGVKFLIPILLPFFIGTSIFSFGLAKLSVISKLAFYSSIIAFIFAISGGIISTQILGYGRPLVVLTFLGLFAITQIIIGISFMKVDPKEINLS